VNLREHALKRENKHNLRHRKFGVEIICVKNINRHTVDDLNNRNNTGALRIGGMCML
jgi:hypothetical protein